MLYFQANQVLGRAIEDEKKNQYFEGIILNTFSLFSIIFNNRLIGEMQGKTSFSHFSKAVSESEEQVSFAPNGHICSNCSSWQRKTQDLIWGYQQLLKAKERELATLNDMASHLDQQLSKSQSKVQSLTRKLQATEAQIDRYRSMIGEGQTVASYYRAREVELLSQLKVAENELFTKNTMIKDEVECREEKALSKMLDQGNRQSVKKLTTMRQDTPLAPILQITETLGKMVQRNLCEIEKMGQEKLVLEVKNRMAMLRAIELSVLK